MTLVDFGVPWDVAFSFEEYERMGMIVIAGELKGGHFDWDNMSWRDEK